MTQPRRPVTQQYLPPGTPVAPATAAGIFRGRQVIIFGTGPGTGLFIYDPAPGAGTLVGSATSAADSDQYGNPYAGPGFAVYSLTGGSGIGMILNGNIAELRFPSGYSGEDQVSRIVTSVLNSGGDFIQQLLAGPSISTAGHTDQAYLELDSSNGTDSAAGQLAYSDAAGNPHLYAFWSAEGVIIERMGQSQRPTRAPAQLPRQPFPRHSTRSLRCKNSWTQRNAVQSTYPLIQLLARRNRDAAHVAVSGRPEPSLTTRCYSPSAATTFHRIRTSCRWRPTSPAPEPIRPAARRASSSEARWKAPDRSP